MVTVGVLHEAGAINGTNFVVALPELYYVDNSLKKGTENEFIAKTGADGFRGPRAFASLFNATHFASYISARGMIDAATFSRTSVPLGCSPPSFIHGLARQRLFRCSHRVRKGRWSSDIDAMEMLPVEKEARRFWSRRENIVSGPDAYTNRTCAVHEPERNRTCTLSNLVGDIGSGSAKVVPNISWGQESCLVNGRWKSTCPLPPRYNPGFHLPVAAKVQSSRGRRLAEGQQAYSDRALPVDTAEATQAPSMDTAANALEDAEAGWSSSHAHASGRSLDADGDRTHCPGSERVFLSGAPVTLYDFNYYGEKIGMQMANGMFHRKVSKVMLRGAGGVS